MALGSVSEYIRQARVLLQDTVADYRYPDLDLVDALNRGLLEIRRLRPELMRSYFSSGVPDFSVSNLSASVPLDEQYRIALLYYICGQAQLRDDENTQDARAAQFMTKFMAQMLTITS
jgi:hypothetical protein